MITLGSSMRTRSRIGARVRSTLKERLWMCVAARVTQIVYTQSFSNENSIVPGLALIR